MSASALTQLDHEAWLVKRLGDHGASVFDGDTDNQTRKERIRDAILSNGLSSVIAGQHNGKHETYAAVFRRLFGEPL